MAWFYSVHTPLMVREDLRKKYEEKRQRLGLEAKWGVEGERKVRLVQEHAVYAGMVEAMDLAVGKVLAKLEELQLADRTIVVFTSDNGGLSTSEGHPTSNLPLRAGKGWLYEGGVREPLIVRAPGVTRPGGAFIFMTTNASGYIGTLIRLMPNRLQFAVKKRIFKMDEREIYPVFMRCNTRGRLSRLLRGKGFGAPEFIFIGGPFYFSFSYALFRIAVMLERLTDGSFKHLKFYIVGRTKKS